MKRFPVLLAVLICSCNFLLAQPKDEQAIRQVLNDITGALRSRDVATLNKIWADDYMFVAPTGEVHNKTQRAAAITSGPAIEFFAYEDPKIRIYANTAVINTRVRIKNAGVDTSYNPTTMVMVKKGDRWQVVSAQGTPAATGTAGANDEQALKAIEQEMLDAILKSDASANERYMAADYVFTSPDGMLMDKSKAIAEIKSGDLKIESSTLSDMKVQLRGNTAVVTYGSTDKGTYKNVAFSGALRWTDIFIKQNGSWKLVAGHGTKVMQ